MHFSTAHALCSVTVPTRAICTVNQQHRGQQKQHRPLLHHAIHNALTIHKTVFGLKYTVQKVRLCHASILALNINFFAPATVRWCRSSLQGCAGLTNAAQASVFEYIIKTRYCFACSNYCHSSVFRSGSFISAFPKSLLISHRDGLKHDHLLSGNCTFFSVFFFFFGGEGVGVGG